MFGFPEDMKPLCGSKFTIEYIGRHGEVFGLNDSGMYRISEDMVELFTETKTPFDIEKGLGFTKGDIKPSQLLIFMMYGKEVPMMVGINLDGDMGFVSENGEEYFMVYHLTENLSNVGNHDVKIISVYSQTEHPRDMLKFSTLGRRLIWERNGRELPEQSEEHSLFKGLLERLAAKEKELKEKGE